MFSRSSHSTPPDAAPPPPSGMREMAPAAPMPPPVNPSIVPPAEESVLAREDDLEGTFRSRGTVRVMGTLKGRIEAARVVIEDGASVEADITVDEAIIAGTYVGGLTCRQRLEVRASGRLSGRVEAFRVMLHEGAGIEGEIHMLKGPGAADTDTVRGSVPVRPAQPREVNGGPAGAGVKAAGPADAQPGGVAPRSGGQQPAAHEQGKRG